MVSDGQPFIKETWCANTFERESNVKKTNELRSREETKADKLEGEVENISNIILATTYNVII